MWRAGLGEDGRLVGRAVDRGPDGGFVFPPAPPLRCDYATALPITHQRPITHNRSVTHHPYHSPRTSPTSPHIAHITRRQVQTELGSVNADLLALLRVILALLKRGQRARAHAAARAAAPRHTAVSKALAAPVPVPYRDCTLTWVLRNILGGNCKTTVLLACAPSMGERSATEKTLRFGDRCCSLPELPVSPSAANKNWGKVRLLSHWGAHPMDALMHSNGLSAAEHPHMHSPQSPPRPPAILTSEGGASSADGANDHSAHAAAAAAAVANEMSAMSAHGSPPTSLGDDNVIVGGGASRDGPPFGEHSPRNRHTRSLSPPRKRPQIDTNTPERALTPPPAGALAMGAENPDGSGGQQHFSSYYRSIVPTVLSPRSLHAFACASERAAKLTHRMLRGAPLDFDAAAAMRGDDGDLYDGEVRCNDSAATAACLLVVRTDEIGRVLGALPNLVGRFSGCVVGHPRVSSGEVVRRPRLWLGAARENECAFAARSAAV